MTKTNWDKKEEIRKKIAKNLENIHQHFETTKLKKHNGKAEGMVLPKKKSCTKSLYISIFGGKKISNGHI
jgi:hypothetical protein